MTIPVHAFRRRRHLLTGGVARPHPLPRRVGDRLRPPATLAHRLRQVAGWIVLAVGILGIVMPLNPAIVVIPAGVALIGRDQWLIRWCRTTGKLLLRKAAAWPGALGRFGDRLRRAEKRFGCLLRHRRLARWLRTHGGADSNPAGAE